MLIYWFDGATGEYRGVGYANEDPREPGRFAIPAEAVVTAPPAVGNKQAAVYRGGQWSVVPDRRGESWFRAYREPVQIVDLGDPALLDLFENEPPPPPPSSEDLIARANGVQMARALGGVSIEIGGAPVHFSTDAVSMGFMNGKALRLQLPNPPTAINWQVGPTDFVSIPAADFLTAAIAVEAFVQETFDKLPDVFARIRAGTISTLAEVDAAFA